MYRLFETIRIFNGSAENISWHNRRFNRARKELLGISCNIDLSEIILVPDEFKTGEVKCRVGYGETIDFITFEPYIFRPVNSLKIVFEDSIEYSYKYLERSQIMELFNLKDDKDDIIIVKNGLVTDSSYCNLVFTDGTKFLTPAAPLLRGTKREKYVFEGKIAEKRIAAEDIFSYSEVHLINAFLDLGRCVLPVSKIF